MRWTGPISYNTQKHAASPTGYMGCGSRQRPDEGARKAQTGVLGLAGPVDPPQKVSHRHHSMTVMHHVMVAGVEESDGWPPGGKTDVPRTALVPSSNDVSGRHRYTTT